MREHVCVRCGESLLLFPSENIVLIEPVQSQTRFTTWIHRARSRLGPSAPSRVLDVRRLIGVRSPAPPEDGVTLHWRSSDGSRIQLLLVDAVEEIVNCYAGDLIDVPILPRRLRLLCNQVMHDPRGGFRLRVKPDVELPLASTSDKRLYAQSLLAATGGAR